MKLDRIIVAYIIDALWLIWLIFWIYKSFGNKRSVHKYWRTFRLLFLVVFVFAWYLCKSNGLIPERRLFYENLATQLLGIALCAAGIALMFWARVILGTNWSGMVTLKENHELITSGPYRFVRHPIYSGLLLAILGTELALNPMFSAVIAMGIVVLMIKLKSLLEEKVMLQTFPQQYPDYKQHVKALIPHIW